jgi:hypothetical protein
MINANSKSIHAAMLAKVLFVGAVAMGVAAGPVMAQDTIGGKFTLNESARLGSTVLGAGRYHFVIETVGIIQSIRSIQEGAGHLVLVVVKPEKAGPSVSIFAMASPNVHGREASELVLAPEKQGTLAQTMYLEKEGLMVNFDWASPKAKSEVITQQAEPRQPAAGTRTAGNY